MVRDHDVSTPALLCHKELAQGTQSPLLGSLGEIPPTFLASLVLYGIKAPIINPFHAWKAQNAPNGGILQLACLEVCCYGIDLGVSIVRFSQ